MNELNERFVAGTVSDDLKKAGILVHQTDTIDGYWDDIPPYHHDRWLPTNSEKFSDRAAAAVINAELPYMFSTSAVGYVLNPDAMQTGFYCACAYDCNSMGNLENHGCNSNKSIGRTVYGSLKEMMKSHLTRLKYGWGHYNSFLDFCVWGEHTINDRSGCQYNELIMNADVWRENMPQVIEAFFYPVNGVVDTSEGTPEDARSIHQSFLLEYGLTADDVPLLEFDVSVANATAYVPGRHPVRATLPKGEIFRGPFRRARSPDEDYDGI